MSRNPWFLALALVLAASGVLLAQGIQFGTLIGTVTLSDGSPASGVAVTVISPALQGERATVSQSNGDFILRGLPPGDYTVRFVLEGVRGEEAQVNLPLGGIVRRDAQLEAQALEESIFVTGEAVGTLESATVGANLTYDTVDALPVTRDLPGIALLAPGVTNNTPVDGQLSISGGLPYDNLFLLDGISIHDNVFGTADDVYIEDAIAETQVLTSAISAEYGRFSGGVVHAITKSGGNEFSGSLRADFTDPSWRDETPLEANQGLERESKLNDFYTATLGGYVVKDRLWFFTSGRNQDSTTPIVLDLTNIPFTQETEERRFEGKLTANLTGSHSLQATYLENDRSSIAPTLGSSITLDTIVHSEFPNDALALRYSGVLGRSTFLEAQYSEKGFEFANVGGTSSDVRDSPINCRTLACLYNGPYFDSTDPEHRDNEQWNAGVSYFLDSERLGSHNLKVGGERFDEIRIGGNSQSPTDFTFNTDPLLDDEGRPVLDSEGRAIPVFTPGFDFLTYAVFWDARRGSRTAIRTDTLYLNDDWKLNEHWSFNLGARYEKTSDENTDNQDVVDTSRITPRLALSFDPGGDGRYRFDATYAQYTGSYNLGLFTASLSTGNPGYLYGPYIGPPGQGRDFAPGFDIDNYFLFLAGSNTQNVNFVGDVHSPTTDEYSFSAGMQLPRQGSLRLTYQNRRTHDLVEDFVNFGLGTTEIVINGVTSTVDRRIFMNSDLAKREYEALLLQGRYRLLPNWTVEGHWTHQLRNHGNYEGTNTSGAAGPDAIGDYPELFDERNTPFGRLLQYQEDVVRLWTTYHIDLGGAGNLSLALLGNYYSPLTYSLSFSQGLSAVQRALDPGYAQPPFRQTLFFGERGSGEYNDWYTFDFAATYGLPFWKRLEPWVKLDVRNLLNDDTLIRFNTAVTPITRNPDGSLAPVDDLGRPTTFRRGPQFGRPRSERDFVVPREYRFAVGIRF